MFRTCLGLAHVLDSLSFIAFETKSEPFVCTPAPLPSGWTAHAHRSCCQISGVLERPGRVIVPHVLDALSFIAFEANSEPFVCTPAPLPSGCTAHAHKTCCQLAGVYCSLKLAALSNRDQIAAATQSNRKIKCNSKPGADTANTRGRYHGRYRYSLVYWYIITSGCKIQYKINVITPASYWYHHK